MVTDILGINERHAEAAGAEVAHDTANAPVPFEIVGESPDRTTAGEERRPASRAARQACIRGRRSCGALTSSWLQAVLRSLQVPTKLVGRLFSESRESRLKTESMRPSSFKKSVARSANSSGGVASLANSAAPGCASGGHKKVTAPAGRLR